MGKISFGTDGWRAIMCEDFTFDNVRIVVQAVAKYILAHEMENRGIVIGFDTRFLAEKFAEVAAEIMTGNGIKVYMVNKATPTPVTAFAVTQHQSAGALMLTASHNPPEYNGIKYIPEYAGPALPAITKEIESYVKEIIETGNTSGSLKIKTYKDAEKEGMVEIINPRPAYEKHVISLLDIEKIKNSGIKVVVDPMFGAGIGYVDGILKQIGVQVDAINNYRDPLFGGSLPEPTMDELGELLDKVKTQQADLGLANDGDADRFGVIDSEGEYITPNQVLVLLLMHLLEAKKMKGAVVRTVATTHLLDRIAAKYGIPVFETPVGFKFVGEKMLNKDVLIGGEESGGLSIKGHIPEKDGILADLLIAELATYHNKPLSEVFRDIMAEFGTVYSKRLDLHIEEDRKQALLKSLKENPPAQIDGLKVEKVLTVDGVKCLLANNSWLLFRPSGTEPLLRVYIEAPSKEVFEKLAQAVEKIVNG